MTPSSLFLWPRCTLLCALIALTGCSNDSAGSGSAPIALKQEPTKHASPDEQFSVLSSEQSKGSPPDLFTVQFWQATGQEPCLASVKAPAGSANLTALKTSVDLGRPAGRLGLGAELLGKCSKRFVYLDGSSGVPGQWGEWIGSGVDEVIHSVRVRYASNDEVVLELRPGAPPATSSEGARLDKMIAETEQAIASGSAVNLMTQRRALYQSELAKLRAGGTRKDPHPLPEDAAAHTKEKPALVYTREEVAAARKKFRVEVLGVDRTQAYGQDSMKSDMVRVRVTNNSDVVLPHLTVLTKRYSLSNEYLGGSRMPKLPTRDLKPGESAEFDYYSLGHLPGTDKITIEVETMFPPEVEQFITELPAL